MAETENAVKDEFLRTAKLLADGLNRRVDKAEDRLERLEDAREGEIDRVIHAIDRLGKLEAIPGRMDKLEHAIRNRDMVVDAKFIEVGGRFDGLETRLDVLENRLLVHDAKEEGKKETVQRAVNIGGWIAKNFWPIIATAAVGGTALKEIPWPTVTVGLHVPENAKIVTIKGRIE